jgi:hypothetical protein
MLADGALVRSFRSFENVAAVSAFPFYRCVFLEDFALFNVGEQF